MTLCLFFAVRSVSLCIIGWHCISCLVLNPSLAKGLELPRLAWKSTGTMQRRADDCARQGAEKLGPFCLFHRAPYGGGAVWFSVGIQQVSSTGGPQKLHFLILFILPNANWLLGLGMHRGKEESVRLSLWVFGIEKLCSHLWGVEAVSSALRVGGSCFSQVEERKRRGERESQKGRERTKSS